MRLLQRLRSEHRQSPENPATSLSNPAAWLVDWFSGSPTRAGTSISSKGALAIAALWCAQRVLAEGVASPPLDVFKRESRQRKRKAPEHPVHRLVHQRPSEQMTSFVWREISMGHCTGWGNWWTEIRADKRTGAPLELLPILPHTAEPITRAGRWFLAVRDPELRVLSADQVVHIPGYGYDGQRGYNPVTIHRENLGLAMSQSQYAGSFYGNAATPRGVVNHPKQLGDKAALALKAQLEQRLTGPDNWNRMLVLEEGMTFQGITIPPQEAAFVASSEFSVLEIARITMVRPHLLMDWSKSSYATQEQAGLDHVKHTLLPWAVKIEQELNAKLFTEQEQERYYIKLNLDGLLRGDLATRYNAYAVARNWGWLNADDVRELEDQDELPDGQGRHYLVPFNMQPATRLDDAEPATPGSSSAPASEATGDEGETEGTEGRAVARAAERRGVTSRRRLQRSFHRLLQEAARRITKRETDRVRGGINRYLKHELETEFRRWLATFYADHQQHVRNTMLPLFNSYAEQMAGAVADELNQGDPADLEQFAREYTERFMVRHTNGHRAQLEQLLDQAEDPEQALELLDERLSEWGEKTPGKVAARETKQAGNALAKAAMVAAGVQALRWVTFGETCPICESLDGHIVGVEQNFVSEGEDVDVDGAAPLRAKSNFGHPPLHQGCDCDVVPA